MKMGQKGAGSDLSIDYESMVNVAVISEPCRNYSSAT